MKRLGLALVLLAAACASGDKTSTTAPPPLPPAPVVVPPPPISTPPALPTPPPDQCGAYLLPDLVGKPRQSIPVPVDPSKRRVVCTTCPMTMDFNPQRLTITYDAETGLVTKLQCG